MCSIGICWSSLHLHCHGVFIAAILRGGMCPALLLSCLYRHRVALESSCACGHFLTVTFGCWFAALIRMVTTLRTALSLAPDDEGKDGGGGAGHGGDAAGKGVCK